MEEENKGVGVFQIASIIHSKLGLQETAIKIHYNHGCDIEFQYPGRRLLMEYANSKVSTSDLAGKLQVAKESGA